MLGAILVICGISQLTQAVEMAPAGGRADTPFLAAVACWAAALCLQSSAARR